MTTPRKKWPHVAEWCRIDCIAIAKRERRTLLAEIERITDIGLLRQLTRTIDALREIESKLTSVGKEDTE